MGYYFNVGKYFGYPDCCAKNYEDDMEGKTGNRPPVRNGIMSASLPEYNTTGFIPCHDHCAQIIKGETTIEELIKDRECPVPFPEEDELPNDRNWETGESHN